jgi:ABC-type branched-subunit amino acid transport system substrate-binding protein
MNRFFSFLFLLSLLASACVGTRDRGLAKDIPTQDRINQGRILMDSGQYGKAAQVFEEASLRPRNQGTTLALYYSGLAYFHQGASFPAEQQFTKLLRNYPKSRYLPEARYHLALLKLRKYDKNLQQQGLEELLSLSQNARSKDLREAALSAVRKYLFEDASIPLLQQYYKKAEEPARTFVLEGLIHQRAQKGLSQDSIQSIYQAHLNKGGKPSSYLEKLNTATEPPKPVHEPNIIKIALYLPLYLDNLNFFVMDEVPRQSRDGLEFYEGFQEAVEEYSPQAQKKIYVQLFDSKREAGLIEQQLQDMQKWAPDMIIGEVFTDASLVIARWAARNRVVQLVPFSANPALISDSLNYTFMARPSFETHGRRMADYAAQQLFRQHVVVWSDQRSSTEAVVQAFGETFQAQGGQVTILEIDSIFEDRAQEDIADHYRESIVDWDSIDGMYIPISNEESAGMILSSLAIQVKREDFRVMGTPVWEQYNLISRQLKDRYGLVYSSPFASENDALTFRRLYNKFVKKYNAPPSKTHIQGYALGKYVLQLLDIYDPNSIPLREFMKNTERFKAVHNDIFFMTQRDNQEVQIFEHREGEVVRVEQ